jgi:hypothetical protein
LDQETTSYFFTNFPEELTTLELWKKFARFARVGEVYIPNKVDKQGQRFGFVKFREVGDAVELLRRISNIWIGSFKLRVNLSKFDRTSKPIDKAGKQVVAKKDNRHVLHNPKLRQDDKSYKNILIETHLAVDGGVKNVAANKAQVPKAEVLWEVEEEEMVARLAGAYVGYLVDDSDPFNIQSNFRMHGLSQLKVCALGFRKVLLWSEKIGEVKEVVETVGWWCSLFERVVPWSPELTTNDRVTWLRCYGVPVNAWGLDLFRAVAFKYGRFIDIDENTKSLKRCDVARIKIVSGEKKLVDSVMAVLIQGRRFDIRVVEESGGPCMEGWNGDVALKKREDDVSSKASSGGGGSAVAVVEGFSESGSDADVSDSCGVLLEVEKRGRGNLQVDNGLGSEIPAAGTVSEDFGKSGGLVEKGVNLDGDNIDEPRLIESAEVEKVLENVEVGSLSTHDKVLADRDFCANVQITIGLDKDGSAGPAQSNGLPSTLFSGADGVTRGGEEQRVDADGPTVLRTRLGDLWIGGSNKKGGVSNVEGGPQVEVGGAITQTTSNDSIESFGAQHSKRGGGVRGVDKESLQRDTTTRTKDIQKKKTLLVFNNTTLPLNMLRKLPGPIHGKKKTGSKKRGGIDEDSEDKDTGSGSNQKLEEFQSQLAEDVGERGSEDESPWCDDDTEVIANTPSAHLEGGGFAIEDEHVLEIANDSREVVEAHKLIAIGKEMGIKFQGGEGDDVARMMGMEVRDQVEKEGMENSNGYQ